MEDLKIKLFDLINLYADSYRTLGKYKAEEKTNKAYKIDLLIWGNLREELIDFINGIEIKENKNAPTETQ